MYIIDQKPFNSPAFCKEVTENIKKYAEQNNFKYIDLLSARKRKDGNGYDWHVNVDVLLQNIPVVEFLKTSLSEKYPEQTALLIQELRFSVGNLLARISDLVGKQSFETTLIADCKEMHASKTSEYYIGSLIDYESPNAVIGLFISKNRCKLVDCDDFGNLLDKKLLIQGKVSYYKDQNHFQIYADSIKVIGQCTRLENLEQWEDICSDVLRSWDEVRSYPEPTKKPTKIGLVASSRTQGYQDFMNTLNKSFGKYVPEVVFRDVPMELDSIIAGLESLCNMSDLDYIAIVRGGGDKESLTKLCAPPMLRAIHSFGNVVTGIGHSDDNLLCGRAALYDAGTPTAAAQFIKTMDSKFFNQQKRNETARKIQETKARTGFRNDKERADHWEAAYKQLEKAYNDLLEENSKPKGILGALKSFFS